MRFLKPYLQQYKKSIFLGQFFKLIEAVLELLLPLIMARLIDDAVAVGNRDEVLRLAVLMVVTTIGGSLAAIVCQVTATRASVDFGASLRKAVFAKVLSLDEAQEENIGAGTLLTNLTNDVNALQQALAMLIRLVVRAPFLALGSIVMAVILSPRLSIIFIVTTPLIALCMGWIMKKTLPGYEKLQKRLDSIARMTRETLEGIRVLRAFQQDRTQEARFDVVNTDYAQEAVRLYKKSALLSPLTSAVMYTGIAAVLYFSGFQVQTGALSQGTVIAFVSYLMQILLQCSVVASLVVLFTKAAASAHRLQKVFDMEPTILDGEKDVQPIWEEPAVEFSHVSFRYPGGGDEAIHDVSFALERGETMGIIGSTGSGKTTLSRLIERQYDPDAGTIRVFGQDVRDYRLGRLRGMIGITPQGGQLMKGTIAQNLRFGTQDAKASALWEALEVAQARAFVEQRKGQLQASVEEGGKNYSGGQRQRLTIARALVKKPQLLILDDAQSALDAVTDDRLRHALRDYLMDRKGAALLIGQRVSAMKECSRILVMEEGKIVGLGTHAQLMESCSVYQEIVHTQEADHP